MRRRGHEGQGIPSRQLLVGDLGRRREAGQGVEAEGGGPPGMELQLSRWRREPVGERQVGPRQVEAHPALLPQLLQGDAGERRMVRIEDRPRQVLVAVVQAGFVQPHRPRQPAEDLRVRQTLARRRDGGLVPLQVHVAVGVVEVGVFRLHGRRQHDVGVVDGVGGEVLDDDGEQVLAREAAPQRPLPGRARRRVGAVEDQRVDRRIVGVEQDFAHAGRGQLARRRGREVAQPEPGEIAGERRAGRIDGAAAGQPPVPGDRRDGVDDADGHAAAGVALHSHGRPDGRGPRRREAPAERDDGVDGDAADLRDPLRRVLEDALAERRPAAGVPVEVVGVLGAHADDDVEQPEGERRVRPRQDGDVLVGPRGGARADGVDGDDPGAVPPRLRDEAPGVVARGQRVVAPQDDKPGAGQVLRVHAGGLAQGRHGAGDAGDRADGHPVPRRAERVPQAEAGPRHALEKAHVPGAEAGPDGLAAAGGDDVLQARGDLAEGLVPADPLERAGALRADAPQRVQQTVRRPRVLEVAVHLDAQVAAGERMVARAAQADGAAVLDRHVPTTGVGAVERTGSAHHAPPFRAPSVHRHSPSFPDTMRRDTAPRHVAGRRAPADRTMLAHGSVRCMSRIAPPRSGPRTGRRRRPRRFACATAAIPARASRGRRRRSRPCPT